MLNKKVVLFWAVSTPVILLVVTVVSTLIIYFYAKIIISDFGAILLGISGFISNLVILGSVLQYFQIKNKTPETPTWEYTRLINPLNILYQ